MQNRVFFPQTALDVWLTDGTVDLRSDELTIVAQGEPVRRYRLREAVRIVQEVSGSPDGNDLVGRVKQKSVLDDKGAELLESSLILGENAYDVIPGWLGEPVGTFEEHVAQRASRVPGPPSSIEPRSDEDLLATYLLKHL
jgi:hypothetical protein